MPRSRRAFAGPLAACVLAGTALGFAVPMHSLPPVTWSSRAPASPHRLYRLKDNSAFRLADLAFGRSGQLRVVFSDPMRRVDLPIEWSGRPPADLRYEWVPVNGTQPRAVLGSAWVAAGINAPQEQGQWKLQLTSPGFSQRV
ncbi:MAG TPA: hypothetical protein VF771_02455, partial [Longimicrobiaceae bacterium]